MRNRLLLSSKASFLAFPRPFAPLVNVRKIRFAPLLTGIKNAPLLRGNI
jgi:hypothetical protein